MVTMCSGLSLTALLSIKTCIMCWPITKASAYRTGGVLFQKSSSLVNRKSKSEALS